MSFKVKVNKLVWEEALKDIARHKHNDKEDIIILKIILKDRRRMIYSFLGKLYESDKNKILSGSIIMTFQCKKGVVMLDTVASSSLGETFHDLLEIKPRRLADIKVYSTWELCRQMAAINNSKKNKTEEIIVHG